MAEPKVRFKQNDGTSFPAWENNTIGHYLQIRDEKQTPSESAPLMAFIAYQGVADKGDRYDRSFLVKSDDKKYKRTEFNDFIYSSNNLDVGSIGLNKYGAAVISVVYEIFKCKENCIPDCINALLQMPQSIAKMLKYRQGALYGQYMIPAEDFLSIRIDMPCLEEQQKIADFLSSVDEVITASEKEVANLKTQKKAVMKKIFSQEVRFKRADGSDFPEWEDVKVLDMLVQPITDGPHETPELVEDGVPFVSVEAIENGRVNLNKRRGNITKEYDELCAKKYKPQLYDVYMVKSGATTGKMGIVTIEDDFNIWSPLAAMRTASKTEAFFLFFMLQSDLLQKQVWTKLSLGNQPNLGMRALEEFNAVRPCLEEQRLIADFLSDFDEAIAAAKKELELWKELKKGLLQQMFV